MANVLINESSMTAIANAIRAKNGTSTTYKPSEMASAISAIDGGGSTPTGTIQITSNGTHDVSAYALANVAVPTGSTPTGTKQISITSNGTTTEDVSAYANAEITVNVAGGGGAGSLFEQVDIEFDNTNGVAYTTIPVSDTSYDNYVVTYSVIASGAYTDGVLTMDETPNVPIGNNTIAVGASAKLKTWQQFTGTCGGKAVTDLSNRCYSISARGSSYTANMHTPQITVSTSGLTITAAQSQSVARFGGTGRYYKYRFLIYGWNTPS